MFLPVQCVILVSLLCSHPVHCRRQCGPRPYKLCIGVHTGPVWFTPRPPAGIFSTGNTSYCNIFFLKSGKNQDDLMHLIDISSVRSNKVNLNHLNLIHIYLYLPSMSAACHVMSVNANNIFTT